VSFSVLFIFVFMPVLRCPHLRGWKASALAANMQSWPSTPGRALSETRRGRCRCAFRGL